MSVKIITDSTSDIQREEAEKLGIGMVPLKVIMDGETYRDGIDLTKEEYFAYLDSLCCSGDRIEYLDNGTAKIKI